MTALLKFLHLHRNLGWILLILFGLGLGIWARWSDLGSLPPAPYWEEVALGYDAYSLVETGKDHHGNPWPVVAFESFGDWKPSGYFYAAMASIQSFGLSVWAIRLPAAIAGSCLLVLLLGIVHTLQSLDRQNETHPWFWPVTTLFVAAVSPWGILFSRAGWEVMLATSFAMAGIWILLNALQGWLNQPKKIGWLFFSILCAVASMYTYHALRFITPLLYVWTIIFWAWHTGFTIVRQHWQKSIKLTTTLLLLGFALTIGLLWPLLENLRSPVIVQRFAETSILNEMTPIVESNAAIATANHAGWAKIVYHRYWFQARLITEQVLTHLHPSFLFLTGDDNARHSIQYFGQLYYLDAVFALVGAVFIWKKKPKLAIWLAGWWLIATLPSALSVGAPHALRTLPSWPVWVLLIAYGISTVIHWQPKLSLLIALGYGVVFVWFWHTYTTIYPKQQAQVWQAGYCEMYQQLQTTRREHPSLPVYISRSAGRPAMYYWFCQKINPRLVQSADQTSSQDQGEYLAFENMVFVRGENDMPITGAIRAIFDPIKATWQIDVRP